MLKLHLVEKRIASGTQRRAHLGGELALAEFFGNRDRVNNNGITKLLAA
jgi:hypothetical protein